MTTEVKTASMEYVADVGKTIEDFLEENSDEIGASRALHALSLLASTLGRNKPEEVKTFKDEWERLRPLIAPFADQIELLSSGKRIDNLIDQVVRPQQRALGSNREKSVFREKKDFCLFYLED